MTVEAVAQHPPLVRVHVWDAVVRLTHWTIAVSITVLSATGLYISRPFLLAPGPAGQHFVMGTIRVIHFYAAIAFSIGALARIAWMFLGKGHARWREFVPVDAERRRGIVQAFLFYAFVRKSPGKAVGHNPLAGLAYLAVFALYVAMIVSGIGLYACHANVNSPIHGLQALVRLFGGEQPARWIHHMVMWLLIGFFVQHFYSVLLTSAVERTGTVDSIFSGDKWVPEEDARGEDVVERRP